MTKSFFLTILYVSVIAAYGQDTDTPLSRTVFKLSPQHFTHNSLKAGVERFNETHSSSFAIFLTGMMGNKNESFYGNGYDGLAGELQFRKYISPMKSYTSKNNRPYHQGVYGAAYLQGGYYTGEFRGQSQHYDPISGLYTWENYNYTENIANGGFGFTIGYQKTLWQVIFLEAFVGGGVQLSSSRYTGMNGNAEDFRDEGITSPLYRGILPKIGLHIGIGL